MKFEDALKALREGKKIRFGHCRCYYTLYTESYCNTVINDSGDEVKFDPVEMLQDDWEIIEDGTNKAKAADMKVIHLQLPDSSQRKCFKCGSEEIISSCFTLSMEHGRSETKFLCKDHQNEWINI